MGRKQRQLDELRSLCGSGAVARALDLAFAHIADFGVDPCVVALLTSAIDSVDDDDDVLRTRLDDLTSIC